MKLLYKDLNVVLAVINETDSAYALLEGNGNCEKVANNFSVSVGDWKEEGQPARAITDSEWKDYIGSNTQMTKAQMLSYSLEIIEEKLASASDEINNYWNAIGYNETVELDETCLLLSLFNDIEKFNCFGICSVTSLKSGCPDLLKAIDTTETTSDATEAPAE
jgi:hypothetical protein